MTDITLVFPFNVSGRKAKLLLNTAWLFKIATHRLLSVVNQMPCLPASETGWKNTFRSLVYTVIPNRRYADGVITLVKGIYESCKQLGIDFSQVELDSWLMFQQCEKEYPCRNITLDKGYKFYITTIDYHGKSERVVVRPTIPKNYRVLLDKILEEKQKYTARVVISDYGVRKNTLWVHGQIQLILPLDFYYKHMARYRENKGQLFGGVDVNTDRINLAIIDRFGRLRDVKTFWFREITARGFPRERAWIIIGQRIHKMLDYAYNHGVKVLFLEDPEVLGKLKLMWIKSGERKSANYNWKVHIFRSSIIERIALKAPLYSIEVKFVNPRGTTNSKEHKELMRKLRLDRHTTSAYLVALRGLIIR